VYGGDNARVAVITGASSGIGLVAAKALASQGWRIIGHGRDPGRIAEAEAQIRAAAAPDVQVDMIRADLALVSEAIRAADEIAGMTDRIDVLYNNAGGTSSGRSITAEGNEATFAGNHLGHFVLTERLLPKLRKVAAAQPPGTARIINVSSSGHEHAPGLNWDDLQMVEGFVPMPAYCNVKLMNILYTRALAKRLAGSGIAVHAMHPGLVDTNFASHGDAATQQYYAEAGHKISAEAGADTLTWLATASEPGRTMGQYYVERAAVPTSAAAEDMDAAERLWTESEKLVAAALKRRDRQEA
jgi:NAD(P)-dependent dehydrogenase (short-subunit alcohol dehydrogenase family)